MALVAYRTLLRSSRIAFQGMGVIHYHVRFRSALILAFIGDIKTLTAARRAARDGFERGRHLPLGSEEASKQIHHAQDVAKILRENVLQGAAIDGDNKFSKINLPLSRLTSHLTIVF
jgi:complex III assembly factor LYRM7